MNEYQSHKKVQASKLASVEVIDTGIVNQPYVVRLHPASADDDVFELQRSAAIRVYNAWANNGSDDPGYYVIYEDGYVSWSPTQAFESGYTLITPSGNPPPTEPNMLKAWQIARVAYGVNVAYRTFIGEPDQPKWLDADPHAVSRMLSGVVFALSHPDATPEDQHKEWCRTHILNGWIWGLEKSEKLKTHPNLVEYQDLPSQQRLKDALFRAIVDAMR